MQQRKRSRMSGPVSIGLNRASTPPVLSFNKLSVQGGTEHRNVSRASWPQMEVDIMAYQKVVAVPGPKSQPLTLYAGSGVSLSCVVDTGSSISLFDGGIAKQLNLNPNGGFYCSNSILGVGGVAIPLPRCQQTIYLDIGPTPLRLNVWFPVIPVAGGRKWHVGRLKENLLGMEDLINERMICFTPTHLFAFAYQ